MNRFPAAHLGVRVLGRKRGEIPTIPRPIPLLRDRDIRLVALEKAQRVMTRHSQEICAERTARGVEASTVSNQRHEHFLGDVLGERGGAAHLQHKAVNASLTAPIQRCKGVFVPTLHHPQQLLVSNLSESGHRPVLSSGIPFRAPKSSTKCSECGAAPPLTNGVWLRNRKGRASDSV